MATSRSTTTTKTGVDAAALANVRSLFAEAQKLYAPGGGYMAGIETGLTRGRGKAVSTGMQNLAAAGLAGTSMMGGLGLKYEEDVAAPARGRAETQRMSALSGILSQRASAEASLAQRYTTQQTTSYSPDRMAPTRIAPTQQRRVAVTRQPAIGQQRPASTSTQPLNKGPKQLFKKLAPAGQWQGTIGDTSFYSTGTGGYTQEQAPPPKKLLSRYYDVGGELGI